MTSLVARMVFVARIERSEIREQTINLPLVSPDFAALYGPGQPLDPGYARSNTLTSSGLQEVPIDIGQL